MRTKFRNIEMKWVLLLGLFLFQTEVGANPSELPKTKSDWMSFDSYNFSGTSSGHTFKGDMYFKRNGVEIDIKTDTVTFMKDAYFKTNSSLIKLEQNKLIISTAEEVTNLKYEAAEVVVKGNKIRLTGNASLKFPNKSTFKANEIVIEKEPEIVAKQKLK